MLEERSIINEDLEDHIVLYDELPVLFLIIEPLEYALNKNYDTSVFDFFRKRNYKRFELPVDMSAIKEYHSVE